MTTIAEAKKEQIRICDESGQFLSTAIRFDVCAKQTDAFCATSNVIVLNDQRQFLVAQRSFTVMGFPGMWEPFFGGHINEGSDFLHTAQIELQEESGLSLPLEDFKLVYQSATRLGNNHYGAFFAVHWSGDPATLHNDPNENALIEWVSFEEYERRYDPKTWCHDLTKEEYNSCLRKLDL